MNWAKNGMGITKNKTEIKSIMHASNYEKLWIYSSIIARLVYSDWKAGTSFSMPKKEIFSYLLLLTLSL